MDEEDCGCAQDVTCVRAVELTSFIDERSYDFCKQSSRRVMPSTIETTWAESLFHWG